jgi:hypothetical protein
MSVYVRDTSSKLLDMEARGSVGQADDRENLVLTAVQCSETRDCKISDRAKVTSGVWKIRTVGLTCSVPKKHKSGDEESKWTPQIFKASSQPLSVNKSNTLYSFSIRSEWLIALRRPSRHRHREIHRFPSYQILSPEWWMWKIRPTSTIG